MSEIPLTPLSNRMKARTAVVTGGAHGLGRAAAECLSEEGVTVAIIDWEEDALHQTTKELKQRGGNVHAFAGDCTKEEEMRELFVKIREKIGDIDILHNNVGGSAKERAKYFHEQTSDVWDFIISQCLRSTLICSRQVVPSMRERRFGKISNIASDSALIGGAAQSEYSAAKAGVIGFTRSLARELAPFGVNVNAICPGPIKTRALDRLLPEILEQATQSIPMKRLGQPRDIGKTVAFLASSDSDYMTGQTLVVNGGRWMV